MLVRKVAIKCWETAEFNCFLIVTFIKTVNNNMMKKVTKLNLCLIQPDSFHEHVHIHNLGRFPFLILSLVPFYLNC